MAIKQKLKVVRFYAVAAIAIVGALALMGFMQRADERAAQKDIEAASALAYMKPPVQSR